MTDDSIEAPAKKRKLRLKPCTKPGCNGLAQGRGLCMTHYHEYRRSPEFTHAPRNVGTPEERFHRSYSVDPSGCWIWIGWTNDKGYGMFDLPGGKRVRAHRFSYDLHKGPIPPGLQVLHKCDTPPCVNPDCLWLGTNQDNARDMVAKGRHASKKGARLRKLTWRQATAMRVLFAQGGRSVETVAWMYGVDPETARAVLKGKSWLYPIG